MPTAAGKWAFSAYLTKPVRQSELRETILRVLGLGPKETDEPSKLDYAAFAARRRSKRLRILLADDNPINRELTVRILSKRGHPVSGRANGQTGCGGL